MSGPVRWAQKLFSRRFFLSAFGALAGMLFVGERLRRHLAGKQDLSSQARTPSPTEEPIVRVAIYPGIGIARIGNSEKEGDDFYDGPEVDTPRGLLPEGEREKNSHRDSNGQGRLKRQAQRFRIYGFSATGKVVREITADEAKIEWSVHLVNKKASWYRFDAAMDIPEALANNAKVMRRNAIIEDPKARQALVLDPGVRTISGRNISGEVYQFSGAKFMGIPVHLGELRTDEDGRLRVLGGKGNAGTPDPAKYKVYDDEEPKKGEPPKSEEETSTFNNANGWYDDTADGPVEATVTIGKQVFKADPAWVVVAPPNYAPDAVGFRTFYDLLMNLYMTPLAQLNPINNWTKISPWLQAKVTEGRATSFTKHILPLLTRMAGLQWVNKGFADQVGTFGEKTPLLNKKSLDDKDVLTSLANKDRGAKKLRTDVFNLFRIPTPAKSASKDFRLWPMLYGDAYGTYENSEKIRFIVPEIQARHLSNWKDGNFTSDYQPNEMKPKSLAEVKVEDQPDMLNKAALTFCLADAFHPGCEVTWPLRHIHAYRAPFRIRQREAGDREPDFGKEMTVRQVMSEGGPLYKQGPGDLTRWMALPWHGDTAFCRSGYEPAIDPYLPTFWPATVPNHVISEETYNFIMEKPPEGDSEEEKAAREAHIEARQIAFRKRVPWLRMLSGGASQQIIQMVSLYAEVGVVEAKPGPKVGGFPPVIFVENLGKKAQAKSTRSAPRGGGIEATVPLSTNSPITAEDKLAQEAGFESAAQVETFRNIRFGKKPR